jgi:serine/threonine protein kinase
MASGPVRPINTAPLGTPAIAAPKPSRPDVVSPEPPSGVSATVSAAAPSPSPPPADATLPRRCSTCQSRYPADFLICPRDGTPLELDGEAGGDPLLGKVLGDAYQVTRVVGEGGMGRVYEARHLRLKDRRFAVKVLHQEYARDTEIVARFQREAESASSISHPNVVDVFDVHKTPDGRPYLVGEFLDGEEYGDYLKKADGPIDVATAVRVTREVCRALSAAHNKGIVHRDMKPENVFLTASDGAIGVKVLDFGISKTGDSSTGANLTKTGVVMGTPSYMAPEQARGDKVDLRADVYAVGAVLYHAVTGKKPFDSDDPTSTLTLVITEDPERPRSVNPSIPETLELVIQKAMAKDPADRYQSMMELDAALAPFDEGTLAMSAPLEALLKKNSGSTIVKPASTQADPTARTMMAQGTSGATVVSVSGEAKLARPTIVMTTFALIVWLVGGFVDGLGGVVRYLRLGELTTTESVLIIVGCLLAAASPTVFFIQRVRKQVWRNSVKSVELAGDLKRTFFVALVTYGLGALVHRFATTIVLHQTGIVGSGLWDAIIFGASFVMALIAGGVGPIARFFRRRKNK